MKITALEILNVGSDIDLSGFEGLGDFTSYQTTKVSEIAERAKDTEILIIDTLFESFLNIIIELLIFGELNEAPKFIKHLICNDLRKMPFIAQICYII